MYNDYWASTDQWTSFRKDPFGNNRPDNVLESSVLSRRLAQRERAAMPNTTCDFSRNAARAPHSNFTFPPLPTEPPVKILSSTYASDRVPPAHPPPAHQDAPRPPPRPTAEAAGSTALATQVVKQRAPVAAPNSANIGHCAFKSERLKTLEANARTAFNAAAAENCKDGAHVVHSHAHLYRWKYPHTLGRMQYYARQRAEEARRERAAPHASSVKKF